MTHLLGPGSVSTAASSLSSGQSEQGSAEYALQLPSAQQKFGQLLDRSTEQRLHESQGTKPAAAVSQSKATNPTADTPVNEATSKSPIEVISAADDTGAHESWLTLLETIQDGASGESSLEYLAGKQGLTGEQLKAALHDALSQLDKNALRAHGKELPETFDLSTTAATLSQLFEHNDALALDPRLSALLHSVGQLPDAQQKRVQSQLAVVIDSLRQPTTPVIDEGQMDALQKLVEDYQQLQSDLSDEQRAAALKHLSADDVAILQALEQALDHALQTQGLDQVQDGQTIEQQAERKSEQKAEQKSERKSEPVTNVDLQSLQSLLATLAESTQAESNVVNAGENSVARLDAETQASEIQAAEAELLQALEHLQRALAALPHEGLQRPADIETEAGELASANARLQTALVELMELLSTASSTPRGVAHDQPVLGDAAQSRFAAMQQLVEELRALISTTDPSAASDETVDTEQVALMMTNLRQLIGRLDTEQSSLSRQDNQPNQQLPPAAQALSDVARQARDQLQAMQLQRPGNDAAENTSDNFNELLQRLETNPSQGNTTIRSSELGTTANHTAMTTSTLSPAMVRETMTAQPPAQSAFETARQTQQAIDILGTGAPERLRERISVMFNTRTQAAEMRLDPPDLGRLTIRLHMNHEQASVSFQVSSPQAREALEHNMPRLRELLAEQGIQLADANVSEQQGQGGQRGGANDNADHAAGRGYEIGDVESEGELLELTVPSGIGQGRVDYYV